MSSHHAPPSGSESAAVAERLLAHARLCEQIAQRCWNEETAADLRRMARDCTHAAATMGPQAEALRSNAQ
jgi:hypothetical protein